MARILWASQGPGATSCSAAVRLAADDFAFLGAGAPPVVDTEVEEPSARLGSTVEEARAADGLLRPVPVVVSAGPMCARADGAVGRAEECVNAVIVDFPSLDWASAFGLHNTTILLLRTGRKFGFPLRALTSTSGCATTGASRHSTTCPGTD